MGVNRMTLITIASESFKRSSLSLSPFKLICSSGDSNGIEAVREKLVLNLLESNITEKSMKDNSWCFV
ncbi:hypothetical protein U1Q18_016643 [Sarracenia purpurea var. burkii]